MIVVPTFAGETVAVLGLGKSGISAALALQAGGAKVWAWDDHEGSRQRATDAGLVVSNLDGINWHDCVALVLSPGIPLNFPTPHPLVQIARSHNCEIIGDIELLCRAQLDAQFVGITGTNGKSTTTTLLGHIFLECGMESEIGGNLGIPVLDLANLGDGNGTYVLELSSYQLDLCPTIKPDMAVLLNITPDHLDRHGDLAGYVDAKRQIFDHQTSDQIAVLGVDDELTRGIYEDLKRTGKQRVIPISVTQIVLGGVYAVDGRLVDDLLGNCIAVLNLGDVPTLTGTHNHQNAAAAYAVARLAGLSSDAIVRAIMSYPGLVHRQERLYHIDNILFVNDSKATNPDAAAKALRSYQDIYWIAGGRAKDGGFDVLTPYLDTVRHAFLVGEAAEEIEQAFGKRIPCHMSGDIRNATRQAYDQAEQDQLPEAVVLFSPACPSFDQFPNFEVRGDFFKECVSALDQGNGRKPFVGGGAV